PDEAPESPYQGNTGTFDTGDRTDWTVIDNAWTKDEFVISEATWWQGYPYNRKGDYHFATFGDEERTGKMISAPFEIGGSGFFTYLMGGNGGYMAVMELSDPTASPNVETDTELARFYNHGFADYGTNNNVINNISFLANMIAYKADMREHISKTVYLLVVDEMTTNWAHIELDSIITYHETEPMGAYRPALADKSELQTLADEMKGVQQGDYDDISWNAFASARAAANEVLRDPRSHVVKIADARSRLQAAYNGLTLKVPTRKDVPLTVEIRKGGSKDVQLLDYVNDNGLALTYTAVCYDDDVTLGTISGSTLPVSITAQAQSGEILISVLYKGEEKLSFALQITVREAAFDVAENPAKKYDLYLLQETSVRIDLTSYVHVYESMPLSFGISNITGAALEGKTVLNDSVLTVSGITASTGTVDVTVEGDGVEKSFTLTVAFIDSTPYRVKNGGFETGDLTDWQILTEGFTGGVINAQTYWGENLPYNQAGNWHLDGWNTGIGEADTWSIRSSTFVLSGTGYISLRMGGNAAAVKVYKENGEQIGYYVQTRFSDTNFPFAGDGAGKGSWADMGTYFIDLHDYIGETLYIELCDVPASGWAHAFFDEVVTYYLELPDIANGYDTVTAPIGKDTSGAYIYGDVQLKWHTAQNRL
ncbi:MAG: hypothetical protein K2L51_04865, partial [Clostridiales bacterium]|nr:hypothetical protein [Clostridiales bacterium]